jgi:hypothetical protein
MKQYIVRYSAILLCGLFLSACDNSVDTITQADPGPVDPAPADPGVTPSPATHLGIYGSTVVEGADDLEFVVSLSAASAETVSVSYETVNGTAIAGSDYTGTNGVLQFLPGEVRKFVSVPVLSNAVLTSDSSKNMQLILSAPQNTVLGVSAATGTIIDNNRDVIKADNEFDPDWSPEGAFTNAAKCGESCHRSDGADMDFNGRDISPGTQWQHSVMANAFNDPYWQAAVEDEVDAFPHLAGFIENTCTTCHAPMGRTHAHHTGTNLDSDGYYRFETAIDKDISREGVSCTACHQIDAGNLGTADSFSGGFVISGDPMDADYKKIYGPYDSPVANNMNMQTGHQPTVGKYVSNSELCATCHTLFTPALDPDTGTPSGTSFLEQGVYFEWQNSVYATGQAQEAQCQDCHMSEPTAGYSTPITLLPNNAPDRSPYGQHSLVGGNAHLLEILSEFRPEIGITDTTSVAGFNEQIVQTRDFLENTAAEITVPALATVGNNLEFDVEVTNNAGHKLPSSYPSRRVWLHVKVKNGMGQVIFESGKPDARGYISTDAARLKADCMSAQKLDGFDSNLCFEPHRNVINDESQVAIYEAVLGDVNDDITHTLLLGSQYLKDNRIPPRGFTNSMASVIETQTIPSGISGDDDFNCLTTTEGCGADTVHYQVDINGQSGPYTVDARLLYQATQPAFVDGMHNNGDRVNRFKLMYDAVPPSVEVLAVTTKQ